MDNLANNYVYTNSNLIYKLLEFMANKSIKKTKSSYCCCCKKTFNFVYVYKHKNLSIKIFESDIHILQSHDMISSKLYKDLLSSKFDDFDVKWYFMATNQLNVLDGLYEVGSNQIYIEKNKNISQSKISRFSEHSGFIYFEKNKVSNINIISGSRVEPSDPTIFMPKNCLEALEVNYIFHTHPKTPYIGSRIKNGIIYEFPSISDIIHFIDIILRINTK
jgi:hypothetical protein